LRRKKRDNGKFRSGFEVTIDAQLKHSGVSYEYESELLKYTRECTYKPDFILDLGSHKIYLEAKGFFKSSDRTKLLRVLKENPGIDLRLIFMQNNKLSKTSNTTYSQWADTHGIPWCLKEIPKEWLKKPRKKRNK